MKESRPVPGQVAVVRCDVPDDKPYYCVTSEGWGPEHPMPEGERYWVPLPDFCEPAEPDEPEREWCVLGGWRPPACPGCKEKDGEIKRLKGRMCDQADGSGAVFQRLQDRDEEVGRLRRELAGERGEASKWNRLYREMDVAMLDLNKEVGTLKGELAHCETILIDCQKAHDVTIAGQDALFAENMRVGKQRDELRRVGSVCAGCGMKDLRIAAYRKEIAEKDNILRSVNEEKDSEIKRLKKDCADWKKIISSLNDSIADQATQVVELNSEIRHLHGMLRQAAEECTGCASLRGELAHCESALIECQENAEQPSVEDYNEEVTRTNAANMAAAERYNAMVDKNNSGQGKKLDKILASVDAVHATLDGWEPK